MLSICIPIYNYDVRSLVNDLHKQAKAEALAVEILLIDDASRESFRKLNSKLKNLPDIDYIELKENIGRSRIRNVLHKRARYPWLLFLDCDSEAGDIKYLHRYIPFLKKEDHILVYGGRSYHPDPPADQTLLHWHFGRHREAKNARIRSKKPYQSFMSNNFLIHKAVLDKVPFNETLRGYGHEDTLLGFELQKNDIPLLHIDNPLIHDGLETAEEFLAKTDEGLKNVLIINTLLNEDKDFIRSIKVLRCYVFLKKIFLRKPFAILFKPFEKPIRNNLLGRNPKLWLLDLYKLGKLCRMQTVNGEQ